MVSLATASPRHVSPTPRSLRVIVAGIVACALGYGLSRFTGWLSDSVLVPVGATVLLLGVLMSLLVPVLTPLRGPGGVGLRWGATSRHWRAVTGSIAAVAVVTGIFRLIGSSAPYESSVGEFVLVPVGEELMFRGLLLTALLMLLDRGQRGRRANTWAVIISALAFGVAHLGNLGYVETQFVVLQVLVATAFGLLAGWLRIRTDSLVGPVLLHMTMNVLAVA